MAWKQIKTYSPERVEACHITDDFLLVILMNVFLILSLKYHQGAFIGCGFCRYDITTADTERLKK